jgi:hypothetical protein
MRSATLGASHESSLKGKQFSSQKKLLFNVIP